MLIFFVIFFFVLPKEKDVAINSLPEVHPSNLKNDDGVEETVGKKIHATEPCIFAWV